MSLQLKTPVGQFGSRSRTFRSQNLWAATQGHSGGKDMASSMLEDRPEGPSSAGLSWIKSSLSFSNGNCVEVASLPDGGVGVRDSKDPSGSVLRFAPGAGQAFLGGGRKEECDRFGRWRAIGARARTPRLR